MEFTVELYETPDGGPVVEAELEAIEGDTPVLYDLLVAGLNKLRRRDYHRPPLCEPLGGGLFELRVGRKDMPGRPGSFMRVSASSWCVVL